MVYSIVINASLLIISLFAGLYTLFVHTDFPKGLNDDEIDAYREVAHNHSRKVKACAATTLALGAVFYVLVPALCLYFRINSVIICFAAALLAFVQMASVLLVFSTMSNKYNI